MSESQPLLSSTTGVGLSGGGVPSFTLRGARWSDLRGAARACSLAFWNDVLFGGIIHPYRHKYPSDNDKYWYRRFVVDWWDWSHVYLVTTEKIDGKGDVITGFAHWSRIAPSSKVNRLAGWELAWWDPSKFLPCCTACLHTGRLFLLGGLAFGHESVRQWYASLVQLLRYTLSMKSRRRTSA